MQRIILFILFSFGCFYSTLAQNSEELKRKQSEIQQEIDDLKKSLADTRKNKKANLGQLALIQKKLRLREAAINNINQQINNIQGSINQSRNEVVRLKKELDTLKIQYEKSIVYAYKNRSNYDFLNFIFSAANFNDALKRIEYLKTYRAYREQHASTIKNTQVLLQKKISGLELTRKEKDEVLLKQQKEKLVLSEEKKEKDEFVSKLKAREKELNKELTAKAKLDRKIRDGIAAAIRRETEKARLAELAKRKEDAATAAKTSGATATKKTDVAVTRPDASTRTKSVFEATPEGEIISDNFEKNRGKLPWPIDKGEIKIHFGTYQIPNTKLKGNNPGLTLETEVGGTVKAVFDGEVSSIFDIEGSSVVLIRHGKYFTTYSNLSSVNVSRGSKVKAGQSIGRAAANGDGNGEIEFLLMQENKNLNPESWLRRR